MLGSKQLLHKRTHSPIILNQNRGLKNWYNKIKNLGASEILDIAVIGDSISEGFQQGANSATLLSGGFKWKLSTYFNNRYDDVGRGFIPEYYPSAGDGPLFTARTGTYLNNNYSVGYKSIYTKTVGDTLQFTFNGTGCEIWTFQSISMGNIDVSIDGGDAVNYDLAVNPTTYPKRLVIASGLEDTNHTVLITNKSTANFHYSGFMEYKGTRGVRVHMCGKSGAAAYYFTDASKVLPAYTALAPDLAIINIGTNDYMTNVAPATFQTNLETLVSHLKSIGTDVIIGTDGTNDRTGFTYEWPTYTGIMRATAMKYDCCFVDTERQWGGMYAARAAGYLPAANPNDIHPTSLGHDSMYETFKKVIMGE